MSPVFPVADDPELNDSKPLVPDVPPFRDLMCTEALLVEVPSPAFRRRQPPVREKLRPEVKAKPAPLQLVPQPAVMHIAPLHPEKEVPEPTLTDPLFPEVVLPELNTRYPLLPPTPELALRTCKMPLLDVVPSPPSILTIPPLLEMLRPEVMVNERPNPLVPLPIEMSAHPAEPKLAACEPICKLPVLPLREVPLLNTKRPLTP